jgi:hypothetical protein
MHPISSFQATEEELSFDEYAGKLCGLIAKTPENASYPATVFATFDLAIKRAVEKRPQAERLMGLVSFFAPDQIPVWLIPEEVMSATERDGALAGGLAMNSSPPWRM